MRQLARWPWGGISVTAASLPSTQCTRVVAPVASFLRQIPSSQRWKQKTSLDYFEAKAKKKQAVRRQAQLRRDAKMSGIPPEKHMPFGHPEFIFTVDPSVCTGCGVKLQHEKPGTLGYYVRIKTPPAEKKKKPNSQKVNEFYKERLQDINHETRVLLQNTQNHVMEDKPKYAVRFENARDRTERKRVEEANAVHLDPEGGIREVSSYSLPKLTLCERCKDIAYHSNFSGVGPNTKSMEEVMEEIRVDNPDPANPPLIVSVVDCIDFPLSFVPFHPPPNSKVIFVFSRGDSLCNRPSQLNHLTRYLTDELPQLLPQHNMELSFYKAIAVSGYKDWGIKELKDLIFNIRNAESNVYLIGQTNTGKSTIVASMAQNIAHKKMRQIDSTLPRRFTPTTSLYPHTTVGNIKIPLNAISLYDSKRKLTDASLYDTPGIEGENSFLFRYLWAAYHKATGLKKLGGFQREPVKMTSGQTMLLGGLVRFDVLECTAHPSMPGLPHIRLTLFSNLPPHFTNPEKAEIILNKDPAEFFHKKSKIEIVTNRPMAPELRVALEMDVQSTKNVTKNTIEVVIAGMGFIAIGGNFLHAKVRVWAPKGKGIGVRRPIVTTIGGNQSREIAAFPQGKTLRLKTIPPQKTEGWRNAIRQLQPPAVQAQGVPEIGEGDAEVDEEVHAEVDAEIHAEESAEVVGERERIQA